MNSIQTFNFGILPDSDISQRLGFPSKNNRRLYINRDTGEQFDILISQTGARERGLNRRYSEVVQADFFPAAVWWDGDRGEYKHTGTIFLPLTVKEAYRFGAELISIDGMHPEHTIATSLMTPPKHIITEGEMELMQTVNSAVLAIMQEQLGEGNRYPTLYTDEYDGKVNLMIMHVTRAIVPIL